MFPIILFDYDTWSATLREDRESTVFENRILNRIFVPKRDKVGLSRMEKASQLGIL